jgi:ribonuclease HI
VGLKHVYIYTDGSCDTTTGDGGWAYLLVYGNSKKEASAFEANTTNNRMELTAAVRALEALKEPCEVTLTTDSQYLRKAFTEGWLTKWQRNGWKTSGKESVKNQDLWEELLRSSKKHTLQWQWTQGHAGHPENERVDKLALMARKKQKSKAEV